MHASDSGYSEYLNDWEPGDEFKPFAPTSFRMVAMGKRPIEDTMAALVCHGALTRNPDLRILSIENGADWVPYLFKQFKSVYSKMPQGFLEDPIEAFRRCVYVAPFWEDDFAQMAELCGIDRVIFGSDWPHPEGLAEPTKLIDDLAGPGRRRAAEGHGRQHDRPVQGPERDRPQARRARARSLLTRAVTEAANPERLLFASTTQSFLEKEASLGRLRELHEAGISFEPDWWRRAAELGWTSLLVPEELGGGTVSGDGVADLALVAELAGRTVAPGPLHPVSTVLAGLVEAPENHMETIESLVSGEAVASWAVYEPGKPWAPFDAGVTATPTGTGFRLDGVKDRVEAGAESAMLLVVANCEGSVRQFLVPTDASGVRVEAQRSIDLAKSYARVHFDGVEVDESAAVGSPTRLRH